MIQALLFGTFSGLSLLFGAMVGSRFNLKQQTIAKFMAFGSGVLICALTFGLMEEAFKHGGFDAVIIGFLLGGIVFILGDYIVHLKGGRKHKRKPILETSNDSNGRAIAFGALLDGIPESAALGIALFNSQSVGILMLAAITLSNFPEGISSISGLRKEGFTKSQIFRIWLVVAAISTLVTVFSYSFLRDIAPNTIGILEAFAAGAILAMLADTMMPEAYEDGGFIIGFLTLLGFLTAFIVSRF